MKPNHVTLADLKELLSLDYLEYLIILNMIEDRIGMETIYNTLVANLPMEDLQWIVERLTITNCITFTDDEYDKLRKLRD